MTAHVLDARGLRCPWPALRLARLMRGVSAEDSVHMLADDPRAEAEVAELARANGWSLSSGEEAGGRIFTILPAPLPQ